MDSEEMEELFPPPFEIYVGCDYSDWTNAVGKDLTKLRETLNEKYKYDISGFRVRINYTEFEGVEFNYEDEVAFFTKIGERRDLGGVLKRDRLSDIVKIIEVVADEHYQEIIDVDKENWRRMEVYEEEGNYKLLFELCEDRELENKKFYYAKKWAEVDSRGLRNLRRCYNRRKDFAMAKKLSYKIRYMTDKDSLNYF